MSDSEDKKRNKLGYQRISIACAHCRRRKIRCLVAEDDSQDRCQNCIRLKKECVFYPVDQQQMLDTRSQTNAKSGAASVPSSAVSPSPPELASGRPIERSRQYGSFPSIPPLPSNAPSNFAMTLGHGGPLPGQNDLIPSHSAHSLSNHEPVGLPPSEYAFQQTPTDSQRHWDQVGDFSSPSAHMTRPRDSMQSQYWARSSPTVASTADFAPFPTAGPPASQMQHPDGHFQYAIPQAQTWNQPPAARSMSYGHLQEAGHQGYIPSAVAYSPHSAHEAHSTNTASYGSSAAPQAPTLASNAVPMGNPMMSFGQPQNPYMFQNPGSVSASPVSSQHPYGNQWFGEQHGYHPSEQDLRSSAEQRSFSGRPSQ